MANRSLAFLPKTKPIGVRFDQFQFETMKKAGYVTSYQGYVKLLEAFCGRFFWTKRSYRKYDPESYQDRTPGRYKRGPRKKKEVVIASASLGTQFGTALVPTSLAQLMAMCPYPEGHVHRAAWIETYRQKFRL